MAQLERRINDIGLVKPGTPPNRWDWLLATVLLVVTALELVLDPGPEWSAASMAPAVVAFGVLPYRRVYPVGAAMAAFAAEFIFEVIGGLGGHPLETPGGHFVAGLILIYALSRWSSPLRVIQGLALTAVMVFVGELFLDESIGAAFLFLIPWVVLVVFALAMRYRANLLHTRYLQHRLAERNDLARELHDTVAHHVSAIAVQAQAAQFVAKDNPEQATAAMKAVEDTANLTIDEMRHMVGILRSDGDQARTVTTTNLVDLVRPDSIPRVEIEGTSALAGLPHLVLLAIYRITQEAITNAGRHSRGASFVRASVELGDGNVTVDIVNDGGPMTHNRGGGYGVMGMRERAEALGGSLEAGPGGGGGWLVRAVLPVTGPR